MADNLNPDEALQNLLEAMQKAGGRMTPEVVAAQKAFDNLTASGKALTASQKAAGAAYNATTNSIKAAGTAAKDFAKTAATSGATLDNMVDGVAGALSSLPLIGGAFKLLSSQTQFTVKALGDLSDVGALGAKGMAGFKDQFVQTGMSMDTWHNTLLQNSATLASFGGTVADGAEKMAAVAGEITKGELGEELRNLGISSNELATGQASYLRLQTMLGKSQKMTNAEMAKGTHDYLTELNELAVLTGISRKDQMKLQEEAMTHAQWSAMIATETNNNNKKGVESMQGMLTLLSKFGPGVQEMFMSAASGMGASTEASAQFFALFGSAGQEMINALKRGGDVTQIFTEQMQPQVKKMLPTMIKLGLINDETFGKLSEMLKLTAEEKKTTKEAIAQTKEKALADDRAAQITEDLNRMNNKLQETLIKFEPMFSNILVKLTEGANDISSWVGNIFTDVDQIVKDTNGSFFDALMHKAKTMLMDGISSAIVDGARRAFGGTMIGDKIVGKEFGDKKTYDEISNAIAKGDKEGKGIYTYNGYEWDKEELVERMEDAAGWAEKTSMSVEKARKEEVEYRRKESERNALLESEKQRLLEETEKIADSTSSTSELAARGSKLDSASITGIRDALNKQGITDKKSQNNILGNIQAESGGKSRSESMKYTPENLVKISGGRVSDVNDAKQLLAQGDEAVGNRLYGGRMGNSSNEGYLYRGRGLVQLTGKASYEKIGKMIGQDLVNNPDLANDPKIAMDIAAAFYKNKVNESSGRLNLANSDAVVRATGPQDRSKNALALRKQYSEQYNDGSANGNLVSGPTSGFLHMLHGTEQIIPVNGGKFPAPFADAFTGILKEVGPAAQQNLIPQLDKLSASINNTNSQVGQQISLLSSQIELMKEMISKMSDVATHTKKTSLAVS